MRYVCLFATVLFIGVCLMSPGAAESKTTIVDVTKFGAVPDDGKSDTAAVIAAVEECRKHKPVILRFPKGVYNFSAAENQKSGSTLFSISGMERLTIDGQGSQFILHGTVGGFWFGSCKGVTAKDFTIDCDRPPFSLGRVTAVEGDHFDVEVFKDYPVTGGEPVGAFMVYDEKTRLPARHGLEEYYTVKDTELVRPQVLRVNLKHEATIKPGVLVLLRHQVYGPSAFVADRSTDVTIKNVSVYAIPGMGFVGSKCTNITLDHFKVIPKPGSGRLMSATADAVHLGGNKGRINITDCEFDGMGDDAVNCKTGLYLIVRSKLDDRTVLAQHNLKMADPPDPGDTIELTDPATMLPFATAVVKSAEVRAEAMHKIEFTEPLPKEVKEGTLLGNATRVAKIRIRNCTVRNNRARGFLIQNRDVVVENCRFENCTSGGIWVLTEVFYFYESIGSRNVTIRNNVFENCNYGGPIGEGVLAAYAVNGPGKFIQSPGVHRNIVFEGNRIIGCDNSAILVSSTDGIVIRNNVIEGACEMPTYDNGKSAIYITASRNVRIEGNTVDPKKQGESLAEPLTLGPNCDKQTFTISDNKGF